MPAADKKKSTAGGKAEAAPPPPIPDEWRNTMKGTVWEPELTRATRPPWTTAL